MYQPVRNPFGESRRSSIVPACCCLLLCFVTLGIFIAILVPFITSEDNVLRLPYLMPSIPEEEVSNAFGQFVSDFHKDYPSETVREERKKAFAQNYKRIAEFNRQPYRKFTLEVNMFADLTDEEFAMKHLSAPKPPHKKAEKSWYPKEPNTDINKNWVADGKVTKIKDQGNCGSCWTFSSISITETLFAIRNVSVPLRFSEQQLVDCCKGPLTHGCHGGEPTDAFNYIKEKGIGLEKDYPYSARDEVCREAEVKPVFHLEGFKDIPSGANSVMEATILGRTMAVGINAAPFVFRFYKSGIIDLGCPEEPINHGVTVVGAGTEDGVPYWYVRNSWAGNWGQGGYVKMKRTKEGDAGICGIASTAQYVMYKEP